MGIHTNKKKTTLLLLKFSSSVKVIIYISLMRFLCVLSRVERLYLGSCHGYFFRWLISSVLSTVSYNTEKKRACYNSPSTRICRNE